MKVFQGLSNKIDYIIFEAHIEFIEEIEEIFNLLKRFGNFEVNFKLGENSEFYYNTWKHPDELLNFLKSIKKLGLYFDIMAKFDRRSEK